jgi:hypothetical protein
MMVAKDKFCNELVDTIKSSGRDEASILREHFSSSDSADNRAKKLIDSIVSGYISPAQKRRQLKMLCFLAGGDDWENNGAENTFGEDKQSQLRLHSLGATAMVFKMLIAEDVQVRSNEWNMSV